jgi:hypothetical protein
MRTNRAGIPECGVRNNREQKQNAFHGFPFTVKVLL